MVREKKLAAIFKSPKTKGRRGEHRVKTRLKELGPEYRVINDVTLPPEDDTTQIDHIVFSKYGVFVIETKNWGGTIIASTNEKWKVVFPEVEHEKQNPVDQNSRHVKRLKEFLKVEHLDIDFQAIFSLVVFAGDAEIKECRYENVVHLEKCNEYIKNKTAGLLNSEEIEKFDEMIESVRLPPGKETDELHKKNCEKRAEESKTNQTTDERIAEAKISQINQTKSRIKTVIIVAILLGLVWAGFVYLIPRLNISNISPIQLENIQPTTQSEQSITSNADTDIFRAQFMEQLAQYEGEVEPKIDEIRLNEWAAEKYAELQDLKARAIESFANGEYLLAREKLQQAGVLVAQASAEYDTRLEAAMRDAQEAFDDDRAPEAEKAVREALRLNPLDAEMLALEKRIAVMPRVLDLLRRAAVAQNENRPEKEAAALREALSIDPSRKAAGSRLKALRAQLKQQRFAGAVRGAQRALDAGDLAVAEQHIALAKNISPASAELGVLQKRLAQARTERAFAAQLSLGEQAKARDDWPVAEKHFERARQLKPDDKTAVENHDLAARVVGATAKIRRTLDREHRLGDQSVLDSVAAYLREVEALAGVSPGLQKLHGELARKVDAYQTEVDVVVVSDNKTHIIVRGVGQVGKTARRTIRLRPGRRVFEGSRSGYQSKLVTVDLVPGAPAVEVSVVCDEKI